MTNSIRHTPLNDFGIESDELTRRSEQVVQVILQRLELRQDKLLQKASDRAHLVILHCVEHRDVQDEAQIRN